MSLTKEEYKLLDRMNKRLRTWQRQGLTNEVINRVKNDLINFYDKYDRAHPSHEYIVFTKSKNLSDREKQELLQIARSMENAKSSSLAYYKKRRDNINDEQIRRSYETIKNNPAYGVNNWQDYIQFVDNMENYRAISASLRELDSKIVARTYAYGKEHNLTTQDINELLLQNVQKYEYGDDFEIFLKTEIERIEQRRLREQEYMEE